MLSVRNLEVSYGGAVRALRGVSIDVDDRGVVAVLGSNGAGKTTLLRAVSGVLRGVGGAIDAGTIEFDGKPLHACSPSEIVGAGVVQVPEGRQIFTRLTVEENLRIGGFSRRDRVAKAEHPGPRVRAVPDPLTTGAASGPACFPAASSRCWPSAGP